MSMHIIYYFIEYLWDTIFIEFTMTVAGGHPLGMFTIFWFIYIFLLWLFLKTIYFYLILQLIYVDMAHKVFDVIYFILFCNIDVNLMWKHLKITNFIV